MAGMSQARFQFSLQRLIAVVFFVALALSLLGVNVNYPEQWGSEGRLPVFIVSIPLMGACLGTGIGLMWGKTGSAMGIGFGIGMSVVMIGLPFIAYLFAM
jgi:hypothetical protein